MRPLQDDDEQRPATTNLRAQFVTPLESGRLGPLKAFDQRLAPTCSCSDASSELRRSRLRDRHMCGPVFEQRDRTIAVPHDTNGESFST